MTEILTMDPTLAVADGRVALTSSMPPAPRPPVLEAALLGHCGGTARPERLDAASRQAIRLAGFGPALEAGDARAAGLYHLPLPLESKESFSRLFPEASRGHWLAPAVADFFRAGGRWLWLVRIPEEEGVEGFLPATAGHDLTDPAALRGLETVLALPRVGVVGLPDLERLQLPRNLAETAPLPTAAPTEPAFLPCAERAADDEGTVLPEAGEAPPSLERVVAPLLAMLARRRPDLQCLYTLPPERPTGSARPLPDPAAAALLQRLAEGKEGHRLQPLFPYLRGPRRPLSSAVGLIAGAIAHGAEERGVWRSVAGRGIHADALPWPRLSVLEAARLREGLGVGVLRAERGRVVLDDERLPSHDPLRRSAEVVRFVGWLMRELRALGERMVFHLDADDPRPSMALEQFFGRLHAAGALRGARPEQAFTLRRRPTPTEGAVLFEIEVAPAFPIDRIVVTLANRGEQWMVEVNDG